MTPRFFARSRARRLPAARPRTMLPGSVSQRQFIEIEEARQNNLDGVSVRIPLGAVTAITGVAGAGKSSLAFDVLYAEGHRRYVETFSAYARQFLERLDRPVARRIDGVLPAIAIDRTAPVRTSRSTVGTMTSIADYLRALYAREGRLFCRSCGKRVERASASTVFTTLLARHDRAEVLIGFRVRTGKVKPALIRAGLTANGLRRVFEDGEVRDIEAARLAPEGDQISVVLDRVRVAGDRRQAIVDSLETAFRFGKGDIELRVGRAPTPLAFSEHLRCADCGIDYPDPSAPMFSFNNPVGACETCKGFGRTMDIAPDLVVPDGRLSIADGCIKPFQTPSYRECQDDLMRFLRRQSLPATTPWQDLAPELRKLVWDGEPDGRKNWRTRWYGISGFFEWLEGRTYKMHVRVFLSRFRHYLECRACKGARLKPDALLFRVDGKTLPELENETITDVERRLATYRPEAPDAATLLLLRELRGRLRFLVDVGLGYLTLARQSRTLSGGEAQRVTLATALGSSLTSTLYVLDEPSVGLHARDATRLGDVLTRLSRAGNAVVVVEHDPAIVRRADHVIDLGPGPGRQGGRIVYQGSVAELTSGRSPQAAASLTGRYLSGRARVAERHVARTRVAGHALRIEGARENNLRDVTVDIPLGQLVCVTGVSGSGKSTLVDQVLYRNLRRAHGHPESDPGALRTLRGAERIDEVVFVDQSPLGSSSRVNAATYMGALEPLRRRFAAEPEAKARKLTASAFSFNAAAGQCPTCQGAGFEKIELQFLPDAFVRCPACNGRRFRADVLEVRCQGHDIASLLDLPAQDVLCLFPGDRKLERALAPMIELGLGYLSLSQPAPTLSGGEAQRLKLAAELGKVDASRRVLYVLDEPTTGLHPDDTARLVTALHRLVTAGQSIVVVEHNLDVVRAADWIIDLGPEGGDGGGRVVAEGTPALITTCDTPTGRALREDEQAAAAAKQTRPPARPRGSGRVAEAAGEAGVRDIEVLGAREHNLKDVTVTFPRNKLVAVTGPSGSGKSTLAFDVLYAEGQRRFLDCLSTYVRQFVRPLARPEVDRVEHVPPTVALEQKLTGGSTMSTVGTASEVYHYLRLLFAWLGVPHCPRCGLAGQVIPVPELAGHIDRQLPAVPFKLLTPLVRKRKGLHKDIVKAAHRQGVGEVRIDGQFVSAAKPPALDRHQIHDVEAVITTIAPGRMRKVELARAVDKAMALGEGGVVIAAVAGEPDRLFSTRRACPRCGTGLPTPDARLFTFSQTFGACGGCAGRGTDPAFTRAEDEAEPDDEAADEDTPRDEVPPCPACQGSRLGPEARAIKVNGQDIGQVAALSVEQAQRWLATLGKVPAELQETVLPELETRLAVLRELGLGYLTIDRAGHTLSTGEAQRVRIVAQLASNLRGVCYVLDEPTVGLHPRDSQALCGALFRLRDRGNTVVVVEHDAGIIARADHLIDLGPAAGSGGGAIVAAGTPAEVARHPTSLTGRWLRAGKGELVAPRRPLTGDGVRRLRVRGARLHNLADVDVDIPLGRLVCVTGVSGSGKSTLVRKVIHRAVTARLEKRALPATLATLEGAETLTRVLEVDETPIGRTPRSVPATYIDIMNDIRDLFAETADARARGFKAGRFSFNVKGGRCERCEGQGRLRVSMSLLPDVYIPCGACAGRRYNADTLAVSYKGKSIADVLAMTVDEARAFFEVKTRISAPLAFLVEIGLGYLQLGQPTPTLSGGEAQRMKLAAELARPTGGSSLFILDEPTTGLHMADVARLVAALHRLVEAGNTVVVIEHNVDVMAAADCIIDLGPESGAGGGQIVAHGPPELVARNRRSRTAPFLREVLQTAPPSAPGRVARKPARPRGTLGL